jgi:hypothetical protein
MRNRTPMASPGVFKIGSPIQRTSNSRDKGHGYYHNNNSRINVRSIMTMLMLLSLGAMGFLFYNKSGSHDGAVGTSPPSNSIRKVAQQKTDPVIKQRVALQKEDAPKAAQDHPKNPNAEVGKNGKLIVRDAEGDIVQDDMLAKDIAAGNVVEHPAVEDAGLDVFQGENRWQHSKTIPDWLKEYFEWHAKVTATINNSTWHEHNYLVMTCLGGEVCGNVAHRLRPIMGMLRVAADSKRIFYIHWDMPDRLEKYLHPPKHGGLNWIVPQIMMWKVRKSPYQSNINGIHVQAFQENRRIVNVMFNDNTFAEPYYNDRRKDGELTASEVLKDAWGVLFQPTVMLIERTKESLRLLGLESGEYAAAHIDYENVPKDDTEKELLRLKVEHALNCMSQLRPGGPYFVAAQTYDIAREAVVYGKQHNVKVHAKEITHDTSTVPKDLFTAFVEIMFMSNARCVAYNRGGYGQLGYLLGYDYNCRIKFSVTDDCKWTDAPPATEEREKVEPEEK